MDEQQLGAALQALREHSGAGIGNTWGAGQRRMRETLMAALGVDEAGADRLVKGLAYGGLIRFRSRAAEGTGGGSEAHTPDAWQDPEAAGDTDLPLEPILAGAALTGQQSGTSAGGGLLGGAVAGAVEAGAGRGGRLVEEAAPGGAAPLLDPTLDQRRVSSAAADEGAAGAPAQNGTPAPGDAPPDQNRVSSYTADRTLPADTPGTWLIA